MEAVMRSYCVFVLLDRPENPPFFRLLSLRRRAKLVWFVSRPPFWVGLLGIDVKPLPSEDSLLLWELQRLPDVRENKMLSLLPLSEKALNFTQKNRELLEISYRMERTLK